MAKMFKKRRQKMTFPALDKTGGPVILADG